MFVDTPGLVDGDMLYPFDVNKSIEWLGFIYLQFLPYLWVCYHSYYKEILIMIVYLTLM